MDVGYQKYRKLFDQLAGESSQQGNNLKLEVENLLKKYHDSLTGVKHFREEKKVQMYFLNSNYHDLVIKFFKLIKRTEIFIGLDKINDAVKSGKIDQKKQKELLTRAEFIISKIKYGDDSCSPHELSTEITRFSDQISAVGPFKEKFMLHLPMIALILKDKAKIQFESFCSNEFMEEFKKLENLWGQLLLSTRN